MRNYHEKKLQIIQINTEIHEEKKRPYTGRFSKEHL